jgi:2'-5' RNA ligase
VAADNLHLTLRFLGNVDSDRSEALSSCLRRIAVDSFALRLGGLGTFGRGNAIRVVWLGVEVGAERLRQLAQEVEACCAENGFEPEQRAYNPHLTLARSRQPRGEPVPTLPPAPEMPAWMVSGFRLYQSRLGKGGAAYSVLAEFGS